MSKEEEKTTPETTDRFKMYRKKTKKSEYVISIIVNVIILYIANNLLAWHVSFITDNWTAPLWILNISIVLTIISSLIFLFYDKNWLKGSLRTIINLVSVVFLITFYTVFPLDVSSGWASIIKILLIIGIVGTVFATLVEFGRIFARD